LTLTGGLFLLVFALLAGQRGRVGQRRDRRVSPRALIAVGLALWSARGSSIR
jgi:hypothetical protein